MAYKDNNCNNADAAVDSDEDDDVGSGRPSQCIELFVVVAVAVAAAVALHNCFISYICSICLSQNPCPQLAHIVRVCALCVSFRCSYVRTATAL